MNFYDAIRSAGMTPPESIRMGQFERFPGEGKKNGNTSGWCKLITDSIGIFGDWSTGLSDVWCGGSTVGDIVQAKAEIARIQEQAKQQRQRDYAQAAQKAEAVIRRCTTGPHQYLVTKGFTDEIGLIDGEDLIVPMRDCDNYKAVISLQRISPFGDKKFMLGGRAKGAVFRIGVEPSKSVELYFCEGYATGLSIARALKNLYRRYCVIVCFSAGNLTQVAQRYTHGVVMADNDVTKTGESAAEASGRVWVMPETVGMDFNDLHQDKGIAAVERVIRQVRQRL